MNKLEYDNLYKFLVSLGIILIVLPLAAMIYFYNTNPILISQVDYDLLSEYSLKMIDNRNQLLSMFIKVLPWFTTISILVGIILISCGIYKWFFLQRKLDKKLDSETTKKALDVLQASDEEISEKLKKETEEIDNIDSNNKNLKHNNAEQPEHPQLKTLGKYYEIEDLCFNYFTRKHLKKFDFKRNIRIGNTYYDFIGVSANDEPDLIFEIKYCRQAAGMSPMLYETFEKIYDMGLKYQTVTHRDFKCIVVVVTPKDHLPRMENLVETYCRAHKGTASQIQIKCMAEEAL